jgi:hypothetical protein
MRGALSNLLAQTDRYIIAIRRPSVSDTGLDQTADLVLDERDELDFSQGIDTRLLRSRRVTVFLVDKNSGVAKIDLTRRNWEIWQGSGSLRNSLAEMQHAISTGGKSRWLTTNGVNVIFWATTIVWFVSHLIWMFADQGARHALNGPHPNYNYPTPHWLHALGHAEWIIWLFCLVASLAVTAIIQSSGGLRVWPQSLTAQSLSRTLFRLRSSTMSLGSAVSIIVSVIGGLLLAIILHL